MLGSMRNGELTMATKSSPPLAPNPTTQHFSCTSTLFSIPAFGFCLPPHPPLLPFLSNFTSRYHSLQFHVDLCPLPSDPALLLSLSSSHFDPQPHPVKPSSIAPRLISPLASICPSLLLESPFSYFEIKPRAADHSSSVLLLDPPPLFFSRVIIAVHWLLFGLCFMQRTFANTSMI